MDKIEHEIIKEQLGCTLEMARYYAEHDNLKAAILNLVEVIDLFRKLYSELVKNSED